MCFEFTSLPFHHPCFRQSLIPLKVYAKKTIFIVYYYKTPSQIYFSSSLSSDSTALKRSIFESK